MNTEETQIIINFLDKDYILCYPDDSKFVKLIEDYYWFEYFVESFHFDIIQNYHIEELFFKYDKFLKNDENMSANILKEILNIIKQIVNVDDYSYFIELVKNNNEKLNYKKDDKVLVHIFFNMFIWETKVQIFLNKQNLLRLYYKTLYNISIQEIEINPKTLFKTI